MTAPGRPLNDDTPAFLHADYEDMAKRWSLVRHVYGGTEALRDDYDDYLWQSTAESDDEFAARAAQTEVFPALKQTIDGLTGVVFRVEPELAEDVPQLIRDHAENIDGQGTHLVVFAKEAFRDALLEGHVGILIDAPAVAPDPTTVTPRLSRQQEAARGVRPYWIKVRADDILSWRTAVINGLLTLTQLVIRETAEVEDGIFTTGYETRFRLYQRADNGTITWRVWTEDQIDNWTDSSFDTPESQGVLTNQTTIPFVAIYGGPRLAPLVSKPPLLDLAYANIAHTNLVSDRRAGLHAALHPILVFKGRIRRRDPNAAPGSEDEEVLGPGYGVDLPADPNADVFYAEHAGRSLGEGRLEVQDVEKRMAAQGLAMLQHDTRAAETAEAKRIDKDEKTANLSSAARSLQDAMELALAYHANYLRAETGGSLVVNREFEQRPLDAQTITAMSGMVANGQMSLETMWTILKSRGLIPEELDYEEELARILMAGGTPPGSTPPTDDDAVDDESGSTTPDSTSTSDTSTTTTTPS